MHQNSETQLVGNIRNSDKRTKKKIPDPSGACTKANNNNKPNNKPSSGLKNDFWHRPRRTVRRRGRQIIFSSLTTTQRHSEMRRERREGIPTIAAPRLVYKPGSKQHALQLTIHPTLPIAVANPTKLTNLAKTTLNSSRTSLSIDAFSFLFFSFEFMWFLISLWCMYCYWARYLVWLLLLSHMESCFGNKNYLSPV